MSLVPPAPRPWMGTIATSSLLRGLPHFICVATSPLPSAPLKSLFVVGGSDLSSYADFILPLHPSGRTYLCIPLYVGRSRLPDASVPSQGDWTCGPFLSDPSEFCPDTTTRSSPAKSVVDPQLDWFRILVHATHPMQVTSPADPRSSVTATSSEIVVMPRMEVCVRDREIG